MYEKTMNPTTILDKLNTKKFENNDMNDFFAYVLKQEQHSVYNDKIAILQRYEEGYEMVLYKHTLKMRNEILDKYPNLLK